MSVPTLAADAPVWCVEAGQVPRIRVDPGTTVEISTLDCRGGAITSMADRWQVDRLKRINPVTGPIAVSGAAVGDTAVIRIERIDLAQQGLMLVRPGTTTFGFVDRGELTFARVGTESFRLFDTELPLRPMVGWVGVQPAAGLLETGACGRTGGNLDTPLLGVGARVLLPIEVPEAAVYVGDVHASQGDGELFLTGIEIGATVTARLDVAAGLRLQGPLVETADVVAVMGPDAGLQESADGACARAIAILGSLAGRSPYEAGFLLSAACDLRISRYLPGYGSVCRLEIPKHVFPDGVFDDLGWMRSDLGEIEPAP